MTALDCDRMKLQWQTQKAENENIHNMNEALTSFPHAHITCDGNYNLILTYINLSSHFQRAQ